MLSMYVLYTMDYEPTSSNSPVGMNDVLGIGHYGSPITAKRYLLRYDFGKRRLKRWLGLYSVPLLQPTVLVYKEQVCKSSPSSPPLTT